MKRHSNTAWFLLLPALAIMSFVAIVPLVTVLNFSFFDIFTLEKIFWVGTTWYEEIITSDRFHASFLRSLLFSALVLGIQIPLGIWLALLLTRAGRWSIVLLMAVAAPLVVPWNMIPIMWLNLIDTKTGIAGQLMAAAGIGFDYKFTALHTWMLLLAMDTWHWLGLVVILAYAGLSAIPAPYYQAAAIDGASRMAIFRHIELPKIGGALSIVVLLRFVDSFMIYTEAFAINAGGPSGATTFLSIDLGEEIKGFSYGSAAARSMVYCLIVTAVVWAFVKITAHQRQAGDGKAA